MFNKSRLFISQFGSHQKELLNEANVSILSGDLGKPEDLKRIQQRYIARGLDRTQKTIYAGGIISGIAVACVWGHSIHSGYPLDSKATADFFGAAASAALPLGAAAGGALFFAGVGKIIGPSFGYFSETVEQRNKFLSFVGLTASNINDGLLGKIDKNAQFAVDSLLKYSKEIETTLGLFKERYANSAQYAGEIMKSNMTTGADSVKDFVMGVPSVNQASNYLKNAYGFISFGLDQIKGELHKTNRTKSNTIRLSINKTIEIFKDIALRTLKLLGSMHESIKESTNHFSSKQYLNAIHKDIKEESIKYDQFIRSGFTKEKILINSVSDEKRELIRKILEDDNADFELVATAAKNQYTSEFISKTKLSNDEKAITKYGNDFSNLTKPQVIDIKASLSRFRAGSGEVLNEKGIKFNGSS